MGLSIWGKETEESIHWSYSTLHYAVRHMAMVHCGMPIYLDDLQTIRSYGLLMMGDEFPESKLVICNQKLLKKFYETKELAEKEFPNILFHSDCDGTYSKIEKVNLNTYRTGNSIELLKELKILLESEKLKDVEFEDNLSHIKAFHDLVEKEIEEGSGVIEFH